MSSRRARRVAFDIGGTFTDVIVLCDDGSVQTAKLLSLLDSVGDTIRTSLRLDLPPTEGYCHGTTVAANALLEDNLAKVGLLTTEGFRDVLEMRSQRRPNVYDVNWTRPKSLVPRELCLEVTERILSDGSVDAELDSASARSAIDRLRGFGVEAIAICFINSYVNGAHERAVAELVRAQLPHVPVTVSADEFPEIREYERTSTTVVNAALMPVVGNYLHTLEKQLRTSEGKLQIMQSNGGLTNASHARRRPVQMIESGPAAGVLAAARLAREVGLPQILALDMGGTTAKATFIADGEPLEQPGGEVGAGANLASAFFGGAGHAIQVPAFDIAEVGAGGGSIAWIDDGGVLRVGPKGAGADPGPVCYGRGGTKPTVTDANLVLGYLDAEGFAGGTVPVSKEAATAAIQKQIAEPLGIALLEAAHGIIQVANATTMRALRAVSIQRGIDPRGVSIVAFGGSGPVHAAALAASLGVSKVYVPPFPGIFSAVGLLIADHRLDAVQGLVMPLDRIDREKLEATYGELERRMHEQMLEQGFSAEHVRIVREFDAQYRGQDKPLTLPLPEGAADLGGEMARRFERAHKAAFGYDRQETAEIVSVRVRALSSLGSVRISELAARTEAHATASDLLDRRACFHPAEGMVDVKVLRREMVNSSPIRGPAIVQEWDTSAVVPPDWTVEATESGCLLLRREETGV